MTDTRIMLVGGTLFDLARPETSAVTLHDLAYALGRICRFGGHTSRFYSVAEHCVHVARLVPFDLGRAALMHDAAEALIGDVTRPLKAMLPEYKLIEARIEADLARRFALPGDPPLRLHDPAVKAADLAMCSAEARALMPNAPGYWVGLHYHHALASKVNIDCRRPEAATAWWLLAWNWFGYEENRDDHERWRSAGGIDAAGNRVEAAIDA